MVRFIDTRDSFDVLEALCKMDAVADKVQQPWMIPTAAAPAAAIVPGHLWTWISLQDSTTVSYLCWTNYGICTFAQARTNALADHRTPKQLSIFYMRLHQSWKYSLNSLLPGPFMRL